MLYVILYFIPDMLEKSEASMRETVDKHFNDNWIITIYMGHVVDLSVEWANYKAARKALQNVLTTQNITDAAKRNFNYFKEAKQELDAFLTEGVLNKQYVLVNLQSLMQCMRKSNVALRWRLLHGRTVQQNFKQIIDSNITSTMVCVRVRARMRVVWVGCEVCMLTCEWVRLVRLCVDLRR